MDERAGHGGIGPLRRLAAQRAYVVVAYVGQAPAAVGRVRLFGEVARLVGAVTLPAFRGRGAYGAVLRSRLRAARQHGATLALTRARPTTSGPILMRRGFVGYNLERCYRVHLGQG